MIWWLFQVDWDLNPIEQLLGAWLGDEATWDPSTRDKLTQDLQLLQQKIAECDEVCKCLSFTLHSPFSLYYAPNALLLQARLLLLLSENVADAGLFQAELDKYVVLAADCQKKLIIY